jgi:hypothetical protein
LYTEQLMPHFVLKVLEHPQYKTLIKKRHKSDLKNLKITRDIKEN